MGCCSNMVFSDKNTDVKDAEEEFKENYFIKLKLKRLYF